MTLRDLFRWAKRYSRCHGEYLAALQHASYDWNSHMAEHGLLLISARCRSTDDCSRIKSIIEKHFKARLNFSELVSADGQNSPKSIRYFAKLLSDYSANAAGSFSNIFWSPQMTHLGLMVLMACYFDVILIVKSLKYLAK